MPEKTYKFPKTLGACADRLWELREARLAQQKLADALETEEKALKEHVVQNLPKGDTGASGRHHRVTVYRADVPSVKDWPKFFAYVAKTKAWDLLQHRFSKEAIEARWAARKKIPGVEVFGVVKVSLEKVK